MEKIPSHSSWRRPAPPPSPHSSGFGKVRTSHACDRCRLMRTKCSGGDRCVKCTKDNAACFYGDRKRERNKKDLVESIGRIQELEGQNTRLLSTLRSLVERPDFPLDQHANVLDLLTKYSPKDYSDDPQDQGLRSPSMTSTSKEWQSMTDSGGKSKEQGTGPSGENKTASSAGSPGRQGELTEVVDLDHGSGATGFVGKMSEMSWIRRAFECVRSGGDQTVPDIGVSEISHQLTTVPDYSYFMDNTDVLAIDEDHVEQYEWPPGDSAVVLVEAYFHAMQGAFQFVLREPFLRELVDFPRHKMPSWSERRWLAMANLVWAVGSLWLQITKLDPSDKPDGHLVYYARARALGIDHRILFDHPDIERVQGIGLLTFYLLVNGSVTRAWNILGQAIRHATALGLHLRVSDPSVSREDRERRARTWYSLYSLEILLCEIVGRPKAICSADMTVDVELLKESYVERESSVHGSEPQLLERSRKLWLDFLRASRNIPQSMGAGALPWKSLASVGQNISPAYLPERLKLCRLSDKIAAKLYSGSSADSWSETQRKIGELQTEMRRWADNLPEELAMQSSISTNTDPRVKVELALYYHSLQMILYRPCLCEVKIENESVRSQDFNRSTARACVHAAMSLLAIIPDNPSAHEAYQLLPWWALLHYVAQATAVLLLELSIDAAHFKNEVGDLADHLRKAMAYLWCMAEGSLSAYRAWRIFRHLLSEVTSRCGDDLGLTDVPVHAPQPHGWRGEHEMGVKRAFG
ncbi:hypothetical protein A1O1_02988 [Capronia coronata CBS 617.96]|uniref:Zn(2)-C6 fungal-type domain-containing protein n=1 Tax=Capronia coronata CBS 617.96 TaxID=1182541 RepID=W9YNT0_9EURO|nr:uncharacterized protein A1O1_02988 [Capronia coronata CBS 617.96]EXJ94592.1 hypothetical protein A1O1_02988 [Capronia coronata CBS 617.96]